MLWYERAVVGTLFGLLATGTAMGSGCGRSDDVAGTTGATTTTGTGGTAGTGTGGADITNFTPCAEASSSASLAAVNMFLAVDKSGSMETDMKWDNAVAAFTSFFQAPEASFLNVALRFWPEDDPMCTMGGCCSTISCDDVTVMCPAGHCDVQACATPQVALGSLSDAAHRQALIDLFNAKMPDGGTPMSAALAGAVQWSRDGLMTSPNERFVIVLVTDGEPNFCNDGQVDGSAADVDAIAQIASDAANDGILTYAVGLQGSSQMQLDQIATAGGTTDAFIIDAGNAQQELVDALLSIAGQAAQCSFDIPPPPAGETLDPKLVRVEYTPGGATAPVMLNHVADAMACGPDGGWYYDDNQNPMTITLCPDTCGEVQADTQAQLDVALGCECEVDEDCPDGLVCIDNHCRPPCTDDSCPAGQICHNERCIPEPGDPCETDAQCPAPLLCVRGQCAPDDLIVVGPFEAVQGGAFTCSATSGKTARLTWLCALIGLTLALMRRRQTR